MSENWQFFFSMIVLILCLAGACWALDRAIAKFFDWMRPR